MNNQKIINNHFNKRIAECIGLWLAEGDSKSRNEITFTNNQWGLVELFHKNMSKLFSGHNPKISIYVYNSVKEKIKVPLEKVHVNYYIDRRATKPYYLWKLASVDLVKQWREIIKKLQNKKELYPYILRGFFAGEGNIKTGSHKNRAIRISQSKPVELIELILNQFQVDYKYCTKEKSYIITSKTNWDRCAKIKIADLHPIKKLRFWNVYNSFKEEHYKNNYLRDNILKELKEPCTSQQLALKFKRSPARVYDVLDYLKKSGKINNFRIKSKDYWILNNENKILISKIKHKYLNMLKNAPSRTADMAKEIKVCPKATLRRLRELKRLGLVKRKKDKLWEIRKANKKVVVLWY